jgi:hypothetical protein
METFSKTHILQNVQYQLLVSLFEKDEDAEPSKSIDLRFPVGHTPVVPRRGDFYSQDNVGYIVAAATHYLGPDNEDASLGRHTIVVRAVRIAP